MYTNLTAGKKILLHCLIVIPNCSQPERIAFGLQSTVARNIADLTILTCLESRVPK